MDSHQIKQHLTDLVLDGREEVAIEELLAMSNSRNNEIRNSISALSSRYQKFEREKIKGALNKESINTTSGRISQALMAIIEHLTEEDEGHLHKIDLEILFKEIDELSTSAKVTPKVKSGKSRSVRAFSIIVPVIALVIAGIFAFKGKFGSNAGTSSLDLWTGKWQLQMQSAGDKKVTGTLSFEVINSKLTGKANNVFPDGSETSNTLSEIKLSDNGNVIEGIWRADDIQSLHGKFKFNLDGKSRFAGTYTVVNRKGEFYWNGTK